MKQLIYFILVMMIISPLSYAGEKIAYLQFSNSAGWTQLVYQLKAKSKRGCKLLNDGYWKGAKTTCPDCKIDYSGCISELPVSYKGVIDNKPLVFPYISSANDRIIYFGMPMNEGKRICKAMVDIYINKLNRPAVCVLPE